MESQDVKQIARAVKDVLSKCIMTKGTKVEKAKKVGELLANRAKKVGVESVIFDRGGFLYHGRIKALADGAREAGLKF